MSLFNTPNVVSQAKTTSSTIASTDDLTVYTITAAATATLPSSTGMYAGYVLANRTGGQGITFVENASTSTAVVTIAVGSGDAIFGTSSVAPGQIVKCESNGSGIWYCSNAGSTAGGGQVQTAIVPLTSANILAMNGTPVSLIAAPGSGKATRVLDISLKMTTTSTQYANGGAVEFRYTDGSGTKVTADIASGVITAGAGTSYTSVGGIEASLTMVTNAAIVVTNATAAFITGTGSGLLSISYKTVG